MNEQGNLLEYISIQGYRRLLSLDLDLYNRSLAVMIGANGVGKTSLLEVFSLLAASAKGQLESKISEYGGLNEILTRDKTQKMGIQLRMSVPQHEPLRYDLQIIPKSQFYEVNLETLTQKNKGYTQEFNHIDSHGANIQYFEMETKRLVRPNWEHNRYETSLSQVPKMFAEPENLRQKLASCTFYGALNVLPNSPVRLPQPMRPVSLPGSNGEDLVSCLYYLRETDPDQFEVIEDTLKTAFPDFEKLSFPPVAAGTLAMTWKDRNFSQPFYMNQLSEGTLRFLWLTTLLLSKELTAITLIDEPEVSLHPQLLSLLADLLRAASQRTQLVVATHADRLVRALDPKEILVGDQENGVTTMHWGDSFDLDRWMSDYTLDELWSMNIFGGVLMRIALIVEGKTEKAFLPALQRYLKRALADNVAAIDMPTIKAISQNGRIPKEGKLKRLVENLLGGSDAFDAVIALTDVYTSKNPEIRDFKDAEDAKNKMREWAGDNPKFYPHAAQHDFEAWLLPYWATIQKLAGHNKNAPSGNPEDVNHDKSPAYHLEEIFRIGKKRDYNKPREAEKILNDNDLGLAISQCPELKSLVNTLLTLSGHEILP